MTESPTNPDLDDPEYWRSFAVVVERCPFWTARTYAERVGIDPQRAAAKVATYLHPGHMTQQ